MTIIEGKKKGKYKITAIEKGAMGLKELGLLPGSIIKCIEKLPFKGPITIECRGSKIALRQTDGFNVHVQPA